MKAEALRELGMFAEASSLLTGSFSEKTVQAAAVIRKMVEQQNVFVQDIVLE